MEAVSEDDLCWLQLEDFRMLLIKTIEPSIITPYLRQCQVISAEDEEQLFHDPSLVLRRRKVGALLDILQRTGEAWSQQQQLRDVELRKMTERVQKLREERERLSEEVKQLRDHNYSLMEDINTLNQDKSNALLANRDLQIEEETPEETPEEKKEEKKEECPDPPQMNLLATVFRLRRELHRAEEQRARSLDDKEELELRCTQLKGDARMYRQRNKQTLRQLEEVIRERDKALLSRAELQEEVRLLLQEKDQYREQVRQLTEQSDRLELLLLRSQGEELHLRTRLRRLTCNSHQGEKSVSSEEEEPGDNTTKGSSDDVRSGTSGENEEGVLQELSSPRGGQLEKRPGTSASWEKQTEDCLALRTRPNFFYRRKRALRSKFTSKEYMAGNHDDDSSGSDITPSD
ncbi:hypothetical protein INR49_020471 [Caranx melampygus]|nr:hypothetical protein INR49_020471 [Caranx melampygus]